MSETIVDKNPQSIEHANTRSNHSHYDLRGILAGNYRFGEISPTYCERVVPDDKNARFQSGTDVRSLNLKSPLMQDVKMYKDYFQVPKSSILPLNWEKLEKMPNIGDDVNASYVNTTIEGFISKFSSWQSSYFSLLKACSTDDDTSQTPAPWKKMSGVTAGVMFRYLNWLSSVFSAGSLVAQLGTNFWAIARTKLAGHYVDELYDSAINAFVTALASDSDVVMKVTFGSGNAYRVLTSLSDDFTGRVNNSAVVAISFRRFLELIKDDPVFTIDFIKGSDQDYAITFTFSDFDLYFRGYSNVVDSDLNIDSLAAYQLAVSHFFTNDKVDYVYSAELYRQNLSDAASYLANSIYGDRNKFDYKFSYNGQYYLYDEFSSFKVSTVISTVFTSIASLVSSNLSTAIDREIQLLNYWNLIFNIRNSLRYMDYFVGAKTRPLGVTDNVNVPVVSSQVSMINVAVGKAYTKLALAVGRVGRKTKKYMNEILHVDVNRDYHNPWFLAHTEDLIGSYETENTNVNPEDAGSGDVQTTISNIRSNSSKYAFEIDVDCESIIICLMSFDMERIYTRTSTRFNRHVDRYDGFIPELQFIGDQPIYQNELDVCCQKSLNFGYRERNAEYKQVVNRAFGAFAIKGVLPGWLMIAADRADSCGEVKLSPSFIRSYPYEFDKFYISLTGKSNATYFHFIIKNTNYLSIDRPMIAKPQIF